MPFKKQSIHFFKHEGQQASKFVQLFTTNVTRSKAMSSKHCHFLTKCPKVKSWDTDTEKKEEEFQTEPWWQHEVRSVRQSSESRRGHKCFHGRSGTALWWIHWYSCVNVVDCPLTTVHCTMGQQIMSKQILRFTGAGMLQINSHKHTQWNTDTHVHASAHAHTHTHFEG